LLVARCWLLEKKEKAFNALSSRSLCVDGIIMVLKVFTRYEQLATSNGCSLPM